MENWTVHSTNILKSLSLMKNLMSTLLWSIVVAYFCSVVINAVPPTPDYKSLETQQSSKISQQPEFIQACKEMAGYYKDPNRNPALSKTILMGGINYSYRDFLHNFKCFTDRLGVKFLPISLDKDIYTYITKGEISPSFTMPDIEGRDKVDASASRFASKNFNLIGCRKLEAVGGALALGYDVIFSDMDIVLMTDPVKYMFFDGVDYVHSENEGCHGKWAFNMSMEGNTGFYSIRSNPKTIRTFDLAYKTCSKQTVFDDQSIFWVVLRTNQNPSEEHIARCPSPGEKYVPKDNSKFVSCPLDSCMFSAGNLKNPAALHSLAQALRGKAEPPVMVHANWMTGKEEKKKEMLRSGVWLAHKEGGFQDGMVLEPVGTWQCTAPQNSSVLFGLVEKFGGKH